MKNTVLLDFDGTIMDTHELIMESWQHTFVELEGRRRRDEDILRTLGEPLEKTMKDFFPYIPIEQGLSIYRQFHHSNFVDWIRLFPGIVELLEALNGDGYKLGIVTSRLEGTTRKGLEKYGILKYFQTIVTADQCGRHKPDPEPIDIALSNLGSTPGESIMVGDTRFDMECAHNAGMDFIAVAWSKVMDVGAMEMEREPIGENTMGHFVANEAMDVEKILKSLKKH